MLLCRSLALLLTATSIFRGQQPPSYTIAGTIVDHLSGRPLPGILVSVTTVARNSEPISVLTAADGRFTFPNLVAGKYALAAERRGARPELYLQHGEFSTAIVTGPGLDSEHITFPLSAPARLSGTVLDSEGDPVPGAQIMLFTQVQVDGLPQLMQVHNAMASQSGAFRFSNLRPSRYYLAVRGHPWYARNTPVTEEQVNAVPSAPPELNVTYPTTYSGDVTDPAAAQPLDLKEGTATELHFHLHAVPSVALALKAPEDPSSGITAYLIGSGPEGIQVNSLQEGGPNPLQMIGLAPGHYELIARFGTKTVRREIDLAASTTMDLSPDESVKCTGRITAETPDSAPVGAGIVLVGRGSAHPGSPEPEGISFYSVPPGRYQVFLTNAPQFYTKAVSLNGKQVTGNDIDIPASGGFEISVLAAHVAVEKLEGVVEKDGTPAAAMMVLLVPEDLSRSSLIRRDQSDSDGSFSLRSVAPGRYTLIAIDGDPELAYRDPAVIKPYLAHGQMVNITPGFNEHLKIEVYRRP